MTELRKTTVQVPERELELAQEFTGQGGNGDSTRHLEKVGRYSGPEAPVAAPRKK